MSATYVTEAVLTLASVAGVVVSAVFAAQASRIKPGSTQAGETDRERELSSSIDTNLSRIADGATSAADSEAIARLRSDVEALKQEERAAASPAGATGWRAAAGSGWLTAVALGVLGLLGILIGRPGPSEDPCIAYTRHLIALDAQLTAEEESSIGRVIEFGDLETDCGDPAEIMGALGDD